MLGTGKDDFSLGVGFIKRAKPYSTLFGLSYTWRGERPGLIIRDTYSFYIGSVKDITDKVDMGLVYAYGRLAFPEQEDLQELELDISYRFTAKTSIRLTGILGLSDRSSDYGFGVSIGFTWV